MNGLLAVAAIAWCAILIAVSLQHRRRRRTRQPLTGRPPTGRIMGAVSLLWALILVALVLPIVAVLWLWDRISPPRPSPVQDDHGWAVSRASKGRYLDADEIARLRSKQ